MDVSWWKATKMDSKGWWILRKQNWFEDACSCKKKNDACLVVPMPWKTMAGPCPKIRIRFPRLGPANVHQRMSEQSWHWGPTQPWRGQCCPVAPISSDGSRKLWLCCTPEQGSWWMPTGLLIPGWLPWPCASNCNFQLVVFHQNHMVVLGQSSLSVVGIAHFWQLGFGGFTPQLQVFMWHLDGKPRCKGGLVDHGCILVINAVLNKKAFWSYSLWQHLSLYAHGAE